MPAAPPPPRPQAAAAAKKQPPPQPSPELQARVAGLLQEAEQLQAAGTSFAYTEAEVLLRGGAPRPSSLRRESASTLLSAGPALLGCAAPGGCILKHSSLHSSNRVWAFAALPARGWGEEKRTDQVGTPPTPPRTTPRAHPPTHPPLAHPPRPPLQS